jgi:glycosyltransferase involved in cell wall biosynthesis
MRILLASDHYPPFLGGAQVQTRLLAASLHERGHDVMVATTWHPGTARVELDGCVEVHRLRQLASCAPKRFQRDFHHQPPYPDPVTTYELRQLIKRFQPHVLNSHGWFTYSCALALTGIRVPLVVSARDYGYSCATRTMLYMGRSPCSGAAPIKCIRCSAEYYGPAKGSLATLAVKANRGLLRRKVVGVHGVSRYVQEVVRHEVFSHPKSGHPSLCMPPIVETVIHELVGFRPVPDARTDDTVCDLPGLPPPPFILFVGALRREKGIHELLDAYQRLRRAPPLVLVAMEYSGIRQRLPRNVILLRDVPHNAIPLAWERALFGVAPSLLPEPLGTVVCEAMTCGRAVIGTDHGGHPDVISHDVNGLLVPPGDVGELARAMQSLLDDPARRHRLERAALISSRRFGARESAARFEQFYDKVLATTASQDRGPSVPRLSGQLGVAHARSDE